MNSFWKIKENPSMSKYWRALIALALVAALALSLPAGAAAMGMGGGGGAVGGMMGGLGNAIGSMMGGNQQNRNVPPGTYIPGNPVGAPGYAGGPGYGAPGYGNQGYGNTPVAPNNNMGSGDQYNTGSGHMHSH